MAGLCGEKVRKLQVVGNWEQNWVESTSPQAEPRLQRLAGQGKGPEEGLSAAGRWLSRQGKSV